jgi:effector-binding domain-containing protein/uncharacterized protein YndB with AHSA1/START domain
MKLFVSILKWVGIVLICLIAISFLLPSKSKVERSLVIQSDAATLFNLVNDLHQWELWSPWHDLDPNMKITYNDIQSGKGASYTWESNSKNVGNGTMEILSSTPNQEILTQMHFGDRGNPTAVFKFTAEGNATKVSWMFEGSSDEVPFYFKPMSKFFGLLMDKMIGPDFEKGLKKLDSVALHSPKIIMGKVESIIEMKTQDQNSISLEAECKVEDIGKTLGELYGKIQTKITDNKLEMAGAPCAMYPGFKPGDKQTKIVACIPTKTLCKGKCDEGMTCAVCKATKCIKVKYLGAYESNFIAYEAAQNYIKEHHLEMAGDPWEEYENDPMIEKDPSKYITNVYWPIK